MEFHNKPGDASKQGKAPDDDASEDCMGPPAVPCECFCLHCRRIFMSDQIWFQRVIGSRNGFKGFWMCPTPNCGGAGFTFDIFPTDPEHPANAGWFTSDDDDDEEVDDEEDFDSEFEPPIEDADATEEYDPDEPLYSELDEIGDDESLEGEEWKHGLAPGERPKVEPPPPGVEPRSQAEEDALYDAPDRRPRELDWTNREDPPASSQGGEPGMDDIPF